MIINAKQLEEFNKLKLEKFISGTLEFLKKNFKAWVTDKADADIRKIIVDTINWAGKYEIDSGLNIQKLLHHKIEFGWVLPLHKKLEDKLTDYKYDQNKRTVNFCLEVESKRYTLIEINMETDLNRITV